MKKIPKWLDLQEEIDYWHFILKKMYENAVGHSSVIEQMIDKSTGFDKKLLKDAKQIIKHVEKLKKQFYKIRPICPPKTNQ